MASSKGYKGKDGFIGAKMSFGHNLTLEDVKNGKGEHAHQWRNRRPICPYGCGEEGNLLEIIIKDDKALGIYTHSGSVKPFTADLQMAPKPTSRKIQIGPDGEAHVVDSETQ